MTLTRKELKGNKCRKCTKHEVCVILLQSKRENKPITGIESSLSPHQLKYPLLQTVTAFQDLLEARMPQEG